VIRRIRYLVLSRFVCKYEISKHVVLGTCGEWNNDSFKGKPCHSSNQSDFFQPKDASQSVWNLLLLKYAENMRCAFGNSADKLRHPRSDAYSAEQVLLNKQQIWGGEACLHC